MLSTEKSPSASLSYLPTELVIGIFESMDRFSEVRSLSLASRKSHEIWKGSTGTICKHVLPREIDCYDEAKELFDAQQTISLIPDHPPGNSTMFNRTVTILANQVTANAVVVFFEQHVMKKHFKYFRRLQLTPTERLDFLRTYYHIMTLATLCSGPEQAVSLVRNCSQWRMLDLQQADELLSFMLLDRGEGNDDVSYLDHHFFQGRFTESWLGLERGFLMLKEGFYSETPRSPFSPCYLSISYLVGNHAQVFWPNAGRGLRLDEAWSEWIEAFKDFWPEFA